MAVLGGVPAAMVPLGEKALKKIPLFSGVTLIAIGRRGSAHCVLGVAAVLAPDVVVPPGRVLTEPE
jgi:hypothetical protein